MCDSVTFATDSIEVATKTADRSLLPPAPEPGVLAPGAWITLLRGGRIFKGRVVAVKEKDIEVGVTLDVTGESAKLGKNTQVSHQVKTGRLLRAPRPKQILKPGTFQDQHLRL